MEKSESTFEIGIDEGSATKRLVIQPEDTTDGIPIYRCYSTDGATIGQLRQEPTGEWTQIWGDLSTDSVRQIGDAIARHIA